MEPVGDLDDLLVGLDARQRRAVTADEMPLAIIAPAGSGKTTVLTRRIAAQVAMRRADPDHLMALTFTRSAALELRVRVGRLGVRSTNLRIGTFHAVAAQLLRQRWADRGRPPRKLVTDKHRLIAEAASTSDRGEIAALEAEIDWARALLIPAGHYGQRSFAEGRQAAVGAARVADVMTEYEALKRRRGVIDFDDLLAECTTELRRDAQYAAEMAWRYRHFYVDEFQDLNPRQHALLEAWRSGRADICVVGDPRQAIYRWNGSDPQLLDEVERTLPGVTVVRLTANYRSTPQIVAAAVAVLATPNDDTVSTRPPGAAVRWIATDDGADELVALARLVAEGHPIDTRWSSIAVLARTNAQLVAAAKALAQAGIPTRLAGGSPPTDPAVIELLDQARRLRSGRDLLDWAFELESASGSEVALPTPVSAARRVVAEAVRNFHAQVGEGEGATFVEWFHGRVDDDAHDGVDLLTFHAAKGREWRTVCVIGFEDGLVPHFSARTKAAVAEERRLAHVALSRATQHLTVTWAATRDGRPTGPSRFLPTVEDDEIEGMPPARPVASATDPGPAAALRSLRDWRRRAAVAASLPEHAVCSDRVLADLARDLPTDAADIARRAGFGPSTARILGPRLATAVAQAAQAADEARQATLGR